MDELEGGLNIFQFLYGAIKGNNIPLLKGRSVEFQFLYGAIKQAADKLFRRTVHQKTDFKPGFPAVMLDPRSSPDDLIALEAQP